MVRNQRDGAKVPQMGAEDFFPTLPKGDLGFLLFPGRWKPCQRNHRDGFTTPEFDVDEESLIVSASK
ncbi:MAG: hypothetical protein WKF84_08150 [Pyrinomonadaceae bacterium]